MYKRLLLLLFLLSTTSCSLFKGDDPYQAGLELTLLITDELRKIETLDDVKERASCLEELFLELAELSIKARRKELEKGEKQTIPQENEIASKFLYNELLRISMIHGASSELEKIQLSSVLKLEQF